MEKSESTINFINKFQGHSIDSLETFLSNEQPRYITVLLCLMSIDLYLISSVPTWCSLFFVSHSMIFVLSSPK